jgi:formylglycine-generating enzyme required for sulfatase activity
VANVNIKDINGFIAKLNAATGGQYRLLTEIEWCVAVGREPENLADYAVFDAESIAPVGTKLPNEYGAYDMRGNVWEWTTTGRKNNRYTLRGGSFVDYNDLARAVYRLHYPAAFRDYGFGFRLFCVLRPPSL